MQRHLQSSSTLRVLSTSPYHQKRLSGKGKVAWIPHFTLSENCQLIIASDACLSQHRRWANIIDDHHYQTGRPAPLIPFCSSTLGLELVWPSFPRPLSFG